MSWVLAGYLAGFNWRYVFWGPVILAAVVLIIWIIFGKEDPETKKEKTNLKETILSCVTDKRVWFAGFGLFGLNIVRYGFLTWAPTYFFKPLIRHPTDC